MFKSQYGYYQGYVIPLDMKGCICHFVMWQIHHFASKGTSMFTYHGNNNSNKIHSTNKLFVCHFTQRSITAFYGCIWPRISIHVRVKPWGPLFPEQSSSKADVYLSGQFVLLSDRGAALDKTRGEKP